MNLQSAARALGGVVSGNGILCPGPGHSARDRSLSVKFDAVFPDGFAVHSHAGDDALSCKDYVREVLGLERFHGRREREPRPVHTPSAAHDPKKVAVREFAAATWESARPIGGTIVQTYLQCRGIIIPHEVLDGYAIRFHPQCPFKTESGEYLRLPAMVAAVLDIRSSEFLALHRTALRPDGSGKALVRGLPEDGRMMLGSNKGGVVKLSVDETVTMGLGIAEGLETALSVMGNLGFRPMWSTLTTSIMKTFPVLPGVEFLTIWADADTMKVNGAVPGIDAARQCGTLWAEAGLDGEILQPPALYSDKGTDWNDVARSGSAG